MFGTKSVDTFEAGRNLCSDEPLEVLCSAESQVLCNVFSMQKLLYLKWSVLFLQLLPNRMGLAPVENLKGFATTRPPLVVFMVCLGLFAFILLTLSFYVQNTELIQNPSASEVT